MYIRRVFSSECHNTVVMLPEGELPPAEEYDSDSWESVFSCELDTYFLELDTNLQFEDAICACEGELSEAEKEEMFNQLLIDVEAAVAYNYPVMVEKDCSCDT